MESKYYTPDISEFYIGFEYEQLEASDTANGPEPKLSWVKKENCHGFGCFDEDLWALEEGEIRVKYLDKKDIEELGFEQDISGISDILQSVVYTINKSYHLFRDMSTGALVISVDDVTRTPYAEGCYKQRILFNGFIKNKSELKQVLKMLNVSHGG